MRRKADYKISAVIISVILFVLSAVSLLCLISPCLTKKGDAEISAYIAEIYQDGELLYRIPLREISECQTFVIGGPEGFQNEIEIRRNGIGVLSATCPDGLCVRQGFIHNDRLPVTCLPNHLVIQLRPDPNSANQDLTIPDMITY